MYDFRLIEGGKFNSSIKHYRNDKATIGVVEAYAESVCIQAPHGVCASILLSADNP